MRDLAETGYIERAEPVLFLGECGTGNPICPWTAGGGLPAEAPGRFYYRRARE